MTINNKIWLKILKEKSCIVLQGIKEILKLDKTVKVDIPIVFYNFGLKKRSMILSGKSNRNNTSLDFNTSDKKIRLIIAHSKLSIFTESNNIVFLSLNKNRLVAILLVHKLQNHEIKQVSIDVNLGSKNIIKSIKEFIYDKLEDEYNLKMFEYEDSKLSKEQFQENKSIITRSTQNIVVKLMESMSATVCIENLNTYGGKSVNYTFKFTREEFNDEIIEVRRKVISIVGDLLSNNKLYASHIDTVVLVGDNAKIPSIYTSIEDTFGVKPNTDMNTSVVLFKELQKDTLK